MEILRSVLAVALLLLFVWILVEACRFPTSSYRAVGHSKIAWICLIVLALGPGAAAYVMLARPKLRAIGTPPGTPVRSTL